jgi:predicted metal-dependent phosphoesterase TrpH
MIVADLHVHTTNSDGTLTVETIPDAAHRADLDAVAVTDHDRIHPELDDPVTTIDGVDVVHGIELRVETADMRIDLLGYGVQQTDRLESLVADLQENRIERAREIVSCVEDETGANLEVDFSPGVGRPHIARAIEASEANYDYYEACADLIGDYGPCYVARDIPAFGTGKQVLDEACAIVGLAHPFRYPDPEAAMSLAPELDAIELSYPYDHEVDTDPASKLADEHDLLITGGSDAHETELGLAGLGRQELTL